MHFSHLYFYLFIHLIIYMYIYLYIYIYIYHIYIIYIYISYIYIFIYLFTYTHIHIYYTYPYIYIYNHICIHIYIYIIYHIIYPHIYIYVFASAFPRAFRAPSRRRTRQQLFRAMSWGPTWRSPTPSEKWWSSSVGMMTFPNIWIIQMFQSTNQIFILISWYLWHLVWHSILAFRYSIWHSLCSGPGPAHRVWSSRYEVRVQAQPRASKARKKTWSTPDISRCFSQKTWNTLDISGSLSGKTWNVLDFSRKKKMEHSGCWSEEKSGASKHSHATGTASCYQCFNGLG